MPKKHFLYVLYYRYKLKLHQIMINIHKNAKEAAEEYGTPGNLVNGANIAGIKKVATAMLAQGLV